MHILVYEEFTHQAIGIDPSSPEHSMYREGLAMRDAIAEDLQRAGHTVRFDVDREPFDYFQDGATPNRVILIAPELDGLFAELVVEAEENWKVPVLCPIRSAIDLTSDKYRLALHWIENEVRTPGTDVVNLWPRDRLPAIVKRIEGAGSTDVFFIRQKDNWKPIENLANWLFIAQDFIPGRTASVAFLIGPKQTVALQPTFQVLSDDGRFHYLGGELPLRSDLAERAIKLGRQAVDCVPGLAGYVGVDLILGDAPDGSEDYAIEINPRLTTSYVGLRQLADFNIAQMMIDVFEGKPVAEPTWKPGRVRFYPDGRVDRDLTPGAVFG